MRAMGLPVMWIGSVAYTLSQVDYAAAVPISRSRNLNSEGPPIQARKVAAPGMEIADLVIVGVLLVAIPLAIALILRWRAGRLARTRTTPKEDDFADDARTIRSTSTLDGRPRDGQRASWASFITGRSDSDLGRTDRDDTLWRSNTASTRQLYISNQIHRAEQHKKAAELERQRESLQSTSEIKTAPRMSTVSSRTMTTLVEGSRPSSFMWTKEPQEVPPVPALPSPPPVLLRNEDGSGIEERGCR
ncbi:hypothetical protein C8F01DRAFT_1165343 [Mycena amicta]|nr:hypothetical protein C8F01DRAFT_1165343 [Mycena amicta]